LSVLENSTPPLESGPEQEVSKRVERIRGSSFFILITSPSSQRKVLCNV